MENKIKNRMGLRGTMSNYLFADNLWTLLITNAEIRDGRQSFIIDKVK